MPRKVLAAVKKAFPNGKVGAATKDTDGGTTSFTISLRSAGSSYEVTLTDDGTITEIAREVAFNALPKPVVAAVLKLYPKAKVETAYELRDGSKMVRQRPSACSGTSASLSAVGHGGPSDGCN